MANEIIKKKCELCAEQIKQVNYKDITILRRFVSTYGRLVTGKRSGNCAKHQRMVTRAVKRARFLALLPFVER